MKLDWKISRLRSECRNLASELNDFTFDMPLEDVEKNHILRTLAYHHGNKTKTAQSLGITIKTLYNKLHRYGILQVPSPHRTTQILYSMSA